MTSKSGHACSSRGSDSNQNRVRKVEQLARAQCSLENQQQDYNPQPNHYKPVAPPGGGPDHSVGNTWLGVESERRVPAVKPP